jgi:hypothetical protein
MPTPVSGSVLQFIDLARGIVGLMILWYIVKFFLVAPPTKEQKEAKKIEQDEKAKKFRDFLGGKYKEHKEAGEKKRTSDKEKLAAMKAASKRKSILNPAKGFLIHAERNLEELKDDHFSDKSDRAVEEAKRKAEEIFRHMKSSKRGLRAARHAAEGDKKEYIKKMYETIEATMVHFENEIVKKMPDPSVATGIWNTGVRGIKTELGKRIGEVAQIIVAIDRFIDEDKTDSVLSPPGRGAPGPYGP